MSVQIVFIFEAWFLGLRRALMVNVVSTIKLFTIMSEKVKFPGYCSFSILDLCMSTF